MKRFVAALCVAFFALAGCSVSRGPESGWIAVIDGEKGLENFDRIGDANWRAEGGTVMADRGKGGHLVTKASYRDFEIYAEFWAETSTNSGIFIRATDRNKVGSANSYEVNIYDLRPGPEYATASIVGFTKVPVPTVYKAGGRWNTLEIRARGNEIVVRFNGQETARLTDGKFREGPFTLQFANGPKDAPGGPIRWRKVLVRPL